MTSSRPTARRRDPHGESRPRDAAATRDAILAAARDGFGSGGYRGTTVKQIADAAGVSPNLITRYFGGKDGLFLAVSDPQIAVDDVFDGDLAGLGRRLADSVVARWAGPAGDDPILLLQRAAGERAEAAQVLSAFLDAHSLAPLRSYLRSQGLAARDAADRAAAIDALIVGMSTRHRILRTELPSPATLRRQLSLAIQALADPGGRA